MATVTNISDTYSIKLNGGTDTSGDVITKSVSFPKVVTAADQDKIIAVVDNLEDCLEFPVYEIQNTIVDYISA